MIFVRRSANGVAVYGLMLKLSLAVGFLGNELALGESEVLGLATVHNSTIIVIFKNYLFGRAFLFTSDLSFYLLLSQ